jgi:transposase
VRGHKNVLKRLLVHASAFNLGLWMRRLFGIGTPRALQGRAHAVGVLLSTLRSLVYQAIASICDHRVLPGPLARSPNGLVIYA